MKPEDIRALRKARHHSAREAAEIVGVHLRTWQRWELGEVPPDLARIELYLFKAPLTDADRRGA